MRIWKLIICEFLARILGMVDLVNRENRRIENLWKMYQHYGGIFTIRRCIVHIIYIDGTFTGVLGHI